MLPDFAQPAFSSAVLCTVRFHVRADGSTRRIRSDYRCQLRCAEVGSEELVDARVYFVGMEVASSEQHAPAVVVLLATPPERFRVGTPFSLHEGPTTTATGTVDALVTR